MKKGDFNYDLEKAQIIENELAEKLKEFGYKNVTTTNDKGLFSAYDISYTSTTTGKDVTIEVKHDMKAKDTNNVCVELYRKTPEGDVPSGLSVTEAKYHVFKLGGKKYWYLIPTNKLKRLIQDNEFKQVIVEGRNVCVLIPSLTFRRNCTKLFGE